MKRTIELNVERPVIADVNRNGGRFGAPRHYGSLKGVDFLAYLSPVKASEDGRVVFSGMVEGTERN